MIEKLFTSKNRVKILGFFLFEREESHIREISRKIKVSVSAVKREVDNLINLGIFKLDKNRISLNKNCNFLGELKSIFIKTDFVVYPIRESLDKLGVDFALVFGSFANMSCTPESDVDLLIIGKTKLSEVYKSLRAVEDKIKREINPVVWTIENLKKQKHSGFVRDIFKKKIIMIKGEEDELREIVK